MKLSDIVRKWAANELKLTPIFAVVIRSAAQSWFAGSQEAKRFPERPDSSDPSEWLGATSEKKRPATAVFRIFNAVIRRLDYYIAVQSQNLAQKKRQSGSSCEIGISSTCFGFESHATCQMMRRRMGSQSLGGGVLNQNGRLRFGLADSSESALAHS
jgi:hypothetical protein